MKGTLLAAAIAVVLAPVAFGQAFEAVVSGSFDPLECIVDPPLSQDALQWIEPDRLERPAPGVLTIASPDHRRVFALTGGFGPGVQIELLSPNGARTPFFTGLPEARESGMAVASNGRVFVTYSQDGSPFVAVISAAGVFEAAYPLAGTAFAVAPDNCTLYVRRTFTTTGVIGRFNVCTGSALPDFGAVPNLRDIDVMPDGRVLAAAERNVFVYSAAGVLLQTFNLDSYGIPAPFPFPHRANQVAVSADGQSIYIAAGVFCDSTGTLLQIALADGAELSRRTLAFGFHTGLVAGAGASAIPAASELGLLMLAGLLAVAGVLVMRR